MRLSPIVESSSVPPLKMCIKKLHTTIVVWRTVLDRGATSRWFQRIHSPMQSHRIPITGETVTTYFIQPCSHEPIHADASVRISPSLTLWTKRLLSLLFSILDLRYWNEKGVTRLLIAYATRRTSNPVVPPSLVLTEPTSRTIIRFPVITVGNPLKPTQSSV